MHRTSHNPAPAVAVRAQLAAANARDALLDGAQRRLMELRKDGERASQTAEYAMLGGVAAAACSALIALLKDQKFLDRVLDTVVDALTKVVRTWF